ncbi:S-adenosyl-L-methionine-dependent methyltransferase [Microthyrium microscopicum]|uniref:S-adenosyl-L-methionine-dependent methyltransferase n=1 Tax=Microthyrium microscopicum TaxID=703497 RepID=A0A6A6UUU8_9PEZI|nr:S-adenosyl-L-methionine-dependent methyltransferase [Microthyrium microscopicum]
MAEPILSPRKFTSTALLARKMGKFNRKKKNKGGGGGNSWANHAPRADYQEPVRENEKLENFYTEQAIIPVEETGAFWSTMRKDLPNSFRFTGSKGHALIVQKRLVEHYIPEMASVKFNGEIVEPPKPVPWFPEGLAWSMSTPKQIVRRHAPFASFQKFLVSETSIGNISRQEVVSMIPPLLMDIKPGMAVLDMCAAPGSKSAQLIESLHAGEEARIRQVLHELEQKQGKSGSPDGKDIELEKPDLKTLGDWSDDGRSTGLLICNDSDYRRAQMLVHQVKRLNSPNLIVTNHDASIFPSIRVPDPRGFRYLKFDRILADVPCTGDGTARKNYNVWKDWVPTNAMGIHPLQVRILVRSLQMLKVGGRCVYSTCSLNPIENEAVVAAAIEICGLDTVKIVDCKDELPGLKRVAGLKKWKNMDRYDRFYDTFEEVEVAKKDPGIDHPEALEKFQQSMFPPLNTSDGEIPLELCMRIYPHHQDTGAFFITVLEKLKEIRPPQQQKAKASSTETSSVIAETEEAQKIDTTTLEDMEVDEPSGSKSPLKRKRDDDDDQILDGAVKKAKDENHADVADADSLKGENDVQDDEEMVETKSEAKSDSTSVARPSNPDLNRDLASSKRKNGQPFEEPYKYLAPDHPAVQSICEFYQTSDRFPLDRFMVRNAMGEPVKAIYYTSPFVRDVLVMNEGKGMKFVQAGVKMFMRQDAQHRDICRWRVQSEGVPIFEPWVGEDRIVRLYKREELRKLLLEMFIKATGPSYAELGEVGERLKEMPMGCCILRVEPTDAEDGFDERFVFPVWRSVGSINLMLPKEDRKAMLLRLFNDNSPLIDNNPQKNKEKAAKEEEAEPAADAEDLPSPEGT